MTKEEVYKRINSIHVIGRNKHIPIEAIKPCSELPNSDIGCYVIKGNTIWYGCYEYGKFQHITVTRGLIDAGKVTVDDPDWWIDYNIATYVPTPRKKIITVKQLIEKLSNYPDNTEVKIGDCKFNSFYFDSEEEYLKIS